VREIGQSYTMEAGYVEKFSLFYLVVVVRVVVGVV